MASEHRSLRDAIWARAWDAGLTSAQLLVALRLVKHFPRMFPGEQTLCRWTRLSESTVRRSLRELEELRILRTVRTPGRGNQYQFLDSTGAPILVPSLGPTPVTMTAAPVTMTGAPVTMTGPTPVTMTAEADPDLKQKSNLEVKAGPEPARALMPHEVSERRQAQETTPGARPVVLFEFRPEWKPKKSHQQLGYSLGLNDDDIGARVHDCRNKTYEKGFTSEDRQFNRELAWAARDKETAAFKQQTRKASNVRDFEQPGHRRAGS